MPPPVVRAARIAGLFALVFGVLWLRFAAGLVRETEADPFVHWALLAVGVLLGLGATAFELNGSGSVSRRDALFALSAGLLLFSALRFSGAF